MFNLSKTNLNQYCTISHYTGYFTLLLSISNFSLSIWYFPFHKCNNLRTMQLNLLVNLLYFMLLFNVFSFYICYTPYTPYLLRKNEGDKNQSFTFSNLSLFLVGPTFYQTFSFSLKDIHSLSTFLSTRFSPCQIPQNGSMIGPVCHCLIVFLHISL